MKRFLSVLLLLVLFPGEVSAWRDLAYAHPANWVVRESGDKEDCQVDLFYVYPTLFSSTEQIFMRWHDDPAMQKKVKDFVLQHTGIFSGYTRVFAPYYRQVEFRRAMKELDLPVGKRRLFRRSVFDVRNAFRYYLKHYNKGRPFILFGFSQGAAALLEVMKTELADPAVNAKLVAAYLIGYPRMPKSFPEYPHLRTARSAFDTGVIISFNSQSSGKVDSPFTGKPECYCINPVNWRTDDTASTFTEHKGSRFFDRKNGTPTDKFHFVTAKIDPAGGGLVVRTAVPGKYDSRVLGKGVYHMYDVNFFYHDLRANGKLRIGAFWK